MTEHTNEEYRRAIGRLIALEARIKELEARLEQRDRLLSSYRDEVERLKKDVMYKNFKNLEKDYYKAEGRAKR